MDRPDWNAIEADFLATGLKYPELAAKWGVSLSTLKKKAMRGGWGDKHANVIRQAEPEPEPQKEPEPEIEQIAPAELALELRTQRSRKMLETTDAMMDRIIDALQVIEPDNTYALATLVKALKDLRDMQGLNKSALDIEEQMARIAKLKSETKTDDVSKEPLVIEFVDLDGAEV